MKKIVFIDSGIGGLHIMRACEKIIDNAHFIYVADTLNAPYGEKKSRFLRKNALKLLKKLDCFYSPDAFVIACNTLTITAIKTLRKHIKIPIIGVEPALKKAKINGGDTILLATPRTLKNYKKLDRKITKSLKKEYSAQNLIYPKEQKIFKLAIKNLPTQIENNLENLSALKPLIEKYLNQKQFENVENLVLGCTHFIALKQIFQEMKPSVCILDNALGVARQVEKVVFGKENYNKKESQMLSKKSKIKITFLTTTASPTQNQKLK